MIISHKYKFIFIHIGKTAGSAIARSLEPFLADDDIFIDRVKGQINLKSIYPNLYKHSTAEEIKKEIPEETWNTYYKFSFVRNPWDMMVSWHFFIQRINHKKEEWAFTKNMSFNEFIINKIFEWKNLTRCISNNEGEVLVDFVGRFESLEKDFKKICQEIGLKKVKLLHTNASIHDHYSKYYTETTREKVRDFFKNDIEMFGYEFKKINNPFTYLRKILKLSSKKVKELLLAKKKVNFLIVGSQKSGTSALNYFLGKHPKIFTPAKKEIHFFDKNNNFIKELIDYTEYHIYFNNENFKKVIGEATPSYMFHELSMQRIHEYNPGMKIIVLLRNPIERAFSSWNMDKNKKKIQGTFSDLIKKEFDIISNKTEQNISDPDYIKSGLVQPNYIRRGFYLNQIERIWKFFPKKQVMIIKNESLMNDHDKTLEEIFTFLKVNPRFKIKQEIKNIFPYTSPMDAESKAFLLNIFKPEIKRLEKILNWDCSDWLK